MVVEPVESVRRAVVLVGGPAAPYSRAWRVARLLAAEGFRVEIAAIAARGLPDREEHDGITLRRYRPRGPWAIVGWSRAMRSAARPIGGDQGEPAPAVGRPRTEPGPSWAMLGRRLTDLAWMAARPLVALRRWLLWPHSVRGWWAALAAELVPADLYHACGVLAVSPALALRRRHQRRSAGRPARVIYDVIDDALSGDAVRGMPGLLRAWHGRREAGWARAVDGLVTVNEALGRRLEARWRPARPIVILPNIPERPDPALVERPPDRIRETLGLGKEIRIVLVHGRIGPHLAIEELEAAVLSMPQTALVLMGFGIGYEAAAARDHDERYRGRHFTLSARPPAELLTWTASADVVVVPLRPTSVNHQLATPNKFWEAVVVGTPVVVPAGLTLLADLVRTHDLGAVARSEQPADLAAALRAILDRPEIERRAWRRRIAAAAAGQFDPAGGADRYRALVRSLWSPDDRGAG